ncbi:hypothetical protein P7K49_018799 [Saguinus oedipus]|uniref:Uncharacterized protein n=1 Tax=Saguinus oedipus TaxID=9490 RepID=A0ABQ9V6E5_SAGOE|nr:hypothetical protein P7K49_018799 [Saguinus oedipus]
MQPAKEPPPSITLVTGAQSTRVCGSICLPHSGKCPGREDTGQRLVKGTDGGGSGSSLETAIPSGEDALSAQLQPVQDLATTPPIPQSEDENSDDYTPVDDVGSLWTTLSTFVALFVLTLLYSGIVTFIKVRGVAGP